VNIQALPKFTEHYAFAPSHIRRAFDKQRNFLKQDIRHPSLHAKKYDESQGIWQARVSKSWRFYFTIEGDMYLLHDIRPHPK